MYRRIFLARRHPSQSPPPFDEEAACDSAHGQQLTPPWAQGSWPVSNPSFCLVLVFSPVPHGGTTCPRQRLGAVQIFYEFFPRVKGKCRNRIKGSSPGLQSSAFKEHLPPSLYSVLLSEKEIYPFTQTRETEDPAELSDEVSPLGQATPTPLRNRDAASCRGFTGKC